jgi:hypothetical protein
VIINNNNAICCKVVVLSLKKKKNCTHITVRGIEKKKKTNKKDAHWQESIISTQSQPGEMSHICYNSQMKSNKLKEEKWIQAGPR